MAGRGSRPRTVQGCICVLRRMCSPTPGMKVWNCGWTPPRRRLGGPTRAETADSAESDGGQHR